MTKPIILVKTCYKTIVFHSSSLKHPSVIGDFLASADVKASGCKLGLVRLIVLLTLHFFYTQGVFGIQTTCTDCNCKSCMKQSILR